MERSGTRGAQVVGRPVGPRSPLGVAQGLELLQGAPPGLRVARTHISTWIRGAAILPPPGNLSPAGTLAESLTHRVPTRTTEAHRGLQDNGGKWPVSSRELLVEETQGQDRQTQLCTGEDRGLWGAGTCTCPCTHTYVSVHVCWGPFREEHFLEASPGGTQLGKAHRM